MIDSGLIEETCNKLQIVHASLSPIMARIQKPETIANGMADQDGESEDD